MTWNLVIIGAGASGTAMLIAYVRRLRERGAALARRTRITVVEATGDFGPGLPYGADAAPFHLMNMGAGTVSVLADRPLDFVDWLRGCGAAEVDGVADVPAMFTSRHLFGRYLRERFAAHVAEARGLGAEVELLAGRVTGVRRAGGGLRVAVAGRGALDADAVTLASGHWHPANTDHCRRRGAEMARTGDGGLFFPWPATRLARAVRPGTTVAVLGTALTAVDAYLTIAHALGTFVPAGPGGVDYVPDGPPVRILAFSRHGLLPGVRTERGPAGLGANPYLAAAPVPGMDEDGELNRAHLTRRLDAAVRWACGEDARPLDARSGGGGERTGTEHALLRDGIDRCRRADPAWAASQLTMRSFLDAATWMQERMSEPERRRVEREFIAPYFVETSAIPYANALYLEALLRAGVLRVFGGFDGVTVRDAFRVRHRDGGTVRVTTTPWLVNAIGRARDLGPHAGLPARLVATGLLGAEPLGGVRATRTDGFARGPDGCALPDVAVLGPLTVGTDVGASRVFAAARRADTIADGWLDARPAVTELDEVTRG